VKSLGFFWKVLGGTVAVILITATGVYIATLPTIERSLQRAAEQRVEHEASWAATLCEQAFDLSKGEFDTSRFAAIAEAGLGSRFTLILADGRVLFDSHQDPVSMDNHASRAEVRDPGRAVTRFSRTLEHEMTYFALPVMVGGQLRGYSRVSVPVEDREARLASFGRAIRSGALVAALVSVLLAVLFARRVTQPLSEIAELVTELGSTQTTRRLGVQREDEVGRLARAVNHMADDLRAQTERVGRDRAEREAIFAALADGLLAVDRDQNVLFINQQARALLGDLPETVKGTPVWELTRSSALIDVISRCLGSETRVDGETRMGEGEGVRVVELTAVPMAGGGGVQRGCVLELRDVSDLRRLEAVRRDFVTNVSHELKTPLTAMRGYTEAILEDEDMPEATRRAFLEKAHRNTERLVAIVGDLLSLSRLESEEHELAFEQLDGTELAQAVVGDLHDLAQARHVRLAVEVSEVPLLVRADAQALSMALSNLITNAIQYSPEGGLVRVVLVRAEGELRFDVFDKGPGVPHHEQERIFERFYRLDKARSRKLGGTGLGLAIVRHVMAAHGGRVLLESEPGEGSRFSLCLPLG
jgi:two-component system, OmpR family, phosphate regulon sensor histidine kinase PhoR